MLGNIVDNSAFGNITIPDDIVTGNIVNSFVEPSSIEGLKLWLDVSALSSLTFNGGDISQIDDLSGGGNHFAQSTAANQPFYEVNAKNGLPALSFNGVTDFLTCVNNFIDTDSDTWFFIFQSYFDGPNNATLLADYGDVSNKLLVFRADTDGLQDLFYVRDENLDIIQVTKPLVETYSLLVTTRMPGKITIDYNDNTASISGTYISTTYVGGSFPHIGVQPSSVPVAVVPGTYLKGHFASAFRYNRILKQPEINQVKSFLKNRWGL